MKNATACLAAINRGHSFPNWPVLFSLFSSPCFLWPVPAPFFLLVPPEKNRSTKSKENTQKEQNKQQQKQHNKTERTKERQTYICIYVYMYIYIYILTNKNNWRLGTSALTPRLSEFIEGAARLRGNAKALDIWRIETKAREVGALETLVPVVYLSRGKPSQPKRKWV